MSFKKYESDPEEEEDNDNDKIEEGQEGEPSFMEEIRQINKERRRSSTSSNKSVASSIVPARRRWQNAARKLNTVETLAKPPAKRKRKM